MHLKAFWGIFLVILLTACATKEKTYRVGVDPSWYPLRISGKESYIYAFSNELLEAIGQEERIHFVRINRTWDNLMDGLEKGHYEAMLSSMVPHIFLEKRFSFSNLFLQTGPVLVLPAGREESLLKDMKGKEIAVDSLSTEVALLKQFPEVTIHYYPSIPLGFDELLSGNYDGLTIGNLQARSYLRDLYRGRVVIATEPLSEEGLRLITLKGEKGFLVERFNQGLEKLRKSGKLEQLMKKWEIQ